MKVNKKLFLFWLILTMSLNIFAQKEDIYKIEVHWDKTSKTKIYIPKDLDDCFVELKKMLHPKFVEKYKSGEIESVDLHFGLGLWMRNNWGLWAGQRLAKYFNNLGLFHPDDMSSLILTNFKLHLNGKPLELEKQIQETKDYWEAMKKPKEADRSFPECPKGIELKGMLLYDRVEGEKIRVTHFGYCQSDKKLWVWENEKGWFEPNEEMLKRINGDGGKKILTFELGKAVDLPKPKPKSKPKTKRKN